jgi:hypothetical protein
MTDFSTLILRDLPKSFAQLDLLVYKLKGGFRGFRQIPSGIHYVSILAHKARPSFWCYLPPNEVVVRVFNSEQSEFVEDEPESAANYRKLAASGAMAKALWPYPPQQGINWWQLTRHIRADAFPPPLHQETTNKPPADLPKEASSEWMLQHHQSRFELAFLDTHGGDEAAFLAEFQFAFVRWLVTSKEQDNEDMEAFTRWRQLLASIYNAGERTIARTPHLFIDLIDALLAQFNQLPDHLFSPDSFLSANANYLIEDMSDTGIVPLADKSQELSTYLKTREVNK